MKKFATEIYKIGINPYVLVPDAVLQAIFTKAGKDKGPVPVKGKIDGHAFVQTLIRYSGDWRLYLNTPMRQAAAKDVGDMVEITLQHDPAERITPFHPGLKAALEKNKKAKAVFDALVPSMKKEIQRYIHNLKTEETREKNIKKAIGFLLGKERFIGRDKP